MDKALKVFSVLFVIGFVSLAIEILTSESGGFKNLSIIIFIVIPIIIFVLVTLKNKNKKNNKGV